MRDGERCNIFGRKVFGVQCQQAVAHLSQDPRRRCQELILELLRMSEGLLHDDAAIHDEHDSARNRKSRGKGVERDVDRRRLTATGRQVEQMWPCSTVVEKAVNKTLLPRERGIAVGRFEELGESLSRQRRHGIAPVGVGYSNP